MLRKTSKEETYLQGADVRIVAGIYRKHGYVGVIAKTMRCYVEVYVPQLERSLRVRKTSIRVGMQTGVEEGNEEGKLMTLLEAHPAMTEELLAICMQFAHCGYQVGDASIHLAVDVALQVAHECLQEQDEDGK
jgi:hypothetical protein